MIVNIVKVLQLSALGRISSSCFCLNSGMPYVLANRRFVDRNTALSKSKRANMSKTTPLTPHAYLIRLG
jgi:hypothetical protein